MGVFWLVFIVWVGFGVYVRLMGHDGSSVSCKVRYVYVGRWMDGYIALWCVCLQLDGLVAPLFAAEDKLQMRKSLIASILDSEQDYVEVLDILLRVRACSCSLWSWDTVFVMGCLSTGFSSLGLSLVLKVISWLLRDFLEAKVLFCVVEQEVLISLWLNFKPGHTDIQDFCSTWALLQTCVLV